MFGYLTAFNCIPLSTAGIANRRHGPYHPATFQPFLMGKTKQFSEPVTVTLNWSPEMKNK